MAHSVDLLPVIEVKMQGIMDPGGRSSRSLLVIHVAPWWRKMHCPVGGRTKLKPANLIGSRLGILPNLDLNEGLISSISVISD